MSMLPLPMGMAGPFGGLLNPRQGGGLLGIPDEEQRRRIMTGGLAQAALAASAAARPGMGLGQMIGAAGGAFAGGMGQERERIKQEEFRDLQARLMEAQMTRQPAAKIIKGADGFNYYASGPRTGERVLPGVQAQADMTSRQQDLEAAGLVPGSPAYQAKMLELLEPQAAVQVNMPKEIGEAQQTIDAIARNQQLYEQTGNERYKRIADNLEMNMIFGGKPPESYVKARGSLNQAREGLSKVYNLVSSGKSAVLPSDRAALQQAFSQVKLAYADLTNRGANFTDTEQALIDSVIGGNPTDIVNRILRGDESYLRGFQDAAATIESRGQDLLSTFTEPGAGTFVYPWEQDEAAPAAAPVAPTAAPAQRNQPIVPAPAQSSMAPAGLIVPLPGTIQEGYRFKGGDPADPNSWEKVQ